MTELDTRTRLLDAAEELFAEHGIEASSMRMITAAAAANLAAVNYHFGSKNALISEVFARRISPLNRERLARIEAAIESSGSQPVPVEALVEALVGPAIEAMDDSERGPALVRLLGRAHSEPSAEVRQVVFAQFEEVFTEFGRQFARTLPHLGQSELKARMKYLIGAMAFAMADPPHLRDTTVKSRGELRRLVAFVSGGLRAPAAEGVAG